MDVLKFRPGDNVVDVFFDCVDDLEAATGFFLILRAYLVRNFWTSAKMGSASTMSVAKAMSAVLMM